MKSCAIYDASLPCLGLLQEEATGILRIFTLFFVFLSFIRSWRVELIFKNGKNVFDLVFLPTFITFGTILHGHSHPRTCQVTQGHINPILPQLCSKWPRKKQQKRHISESCQRAIIYERCMGAATCNFHIT